MAQTNRKGIPLQPFIGRGAALNRAIISTLEDKQPQTTRQIGKNVTSTRKFKGTSLSTVNKRVRNLEEQGYLSKTQVKERIGGPTNYYQLTPKAYLARFIDSNSIEDLFEKISGETALILLADLANTKLDKETQKQ